MQETQVGALGPGRSPGERHGNPLQYSCLENPMDRGAWQAMVHGVLKSRTRLSDNTSLHSGCIYFSSKLKLYLVRAPIGSFASTSNWEQRYSLGDFQHDPSHQRQLLCKPKQIGFQIRKNLLDKQGLKHRSLFKKEKERKAQIKAKQNKKNHQ